MKKSFRRVVALFSVIALVSVLFASPSNAVDVPTGVGSATGGVTLASIDYGDLLTAALLGESNGATIDPVNGTPVAIESLSPLNIHTSLLGDINLPPITVTSTGDPVSQDSALVDLSTLGIPGLTGAINPATLLSQVDTAGALASLNSTLADVGLIGVLGIDSASLGLSGLAGPTAATSSRGATVDAITVLDLEALLNLVGLTVGDLPLDVLADLVSQLGELGALNALLGTTFDNPGDLATALTNAAALIAPAQSALDGAQATLASEAENLALQQYALTFCFGVPVCVAIMQPVVDAAQAAVDAAQAAVDAAQEVVDDLVALLQGVIDLLTGTPLLSIEGVQAGAFANAVDTVANSAATVTAAIGHIRVGGIDLGVVDVNTTLDQVAALADNVVSTLNGVLAFISPELVNILSVNLFDRSTSVAQNGDYVQALASITALAATITPPDICAVLDDVLGGTTLPGGLDLPDSPVSDALTELGSGVPSCLQEVALTASGLQAAALPEDTFAALTGPVTLRAASVSSAAEFRVVSSTTSTPDDPQLPRTGMNETLLLVIGGLMAAAALGLRRVTSPVKVRSRRS